VQTLPNPSPSSPSKALPIQSLQVLMAKAGWEIDYLDVDLTQQSPVVQIKCHREDGRWLYAKTDSLGRCSMETFQRNSWLGKPANSKGKWPQSPQVDDIFLGRYKPKDTAALMRYFTSYVIDNSTALIALDDMRQEWAAVMAEPSKLIG
jgi:hypothetical protein